LNKNSKEFGKQYMFDGSEETCWNSHQGSPQFVIFDFNSTVEIRQIKNTEMHLHCILRAERVIGRTKRLAHDS